MKHSINQHKALHRSLSLAASNCMQHSPGPTTLSFQYRKVVSQHLQRLCSTCSSIISPICFVVLTVFCLQQVWKVSWESGAGVHLWGMYCPLPAGDWQSGIMFKLLNFPLKSVSLSRQKCLCVRVCVSLCVCVCVCVSSSSALFECECE